MWGVPSGCEADPDAPWGRAGHPWHRQTRSSMPTRCSQAHHQGVSQPGRRSLPKCKQGPAWVGPDPAHPAWSPTQQGEAGSPSGLPAAHPAFQARCGGEIRQDMQHAGVSSHMATHRAGPGYRSRRRRGRGRQRGQARGGMRQRGRGRLSGRGPSRGYQEVLQTSAQKRQEIATPTLCDTQATCSLACHRSDHGHP